MNFRLGIATILLLVWTAAAQQSAADLIVVNANIRTMDSAKPRAEAMAVSNGMIVAVGSNDEVRKLASKDARVIDAEGRLVIPGFNDSHVHFMAIGNTFSSMDLRAATGPQAMIDRIQSNVRFLPKGRWVLGGGWDQSKWDGAALPTRAEIDRLSPDHPVFLYNVDPNTAFANGLALQKAGITKATRDPEGGEIVRDDNGEPSGVLKGRAVALVARLVPPDHSRRWSEVAETASNYAASLGVTSVMDTHGDDMAAVYRQMQSEGKLKTRVYDCLQLSEWAKTKHKPPANTNGLLRTGCLKSFSDGSEEWTATLLADAVAADKLGWQLTIHAIGGVSNSVVLDVFEKIAKEGGPRDRRWQIEHATGVRDEDLARIKQLGVVASMQPYLFGGVFGADAVYYRRMFENAAAVAFGSDAPMTEFNPLLGLYAAVLGGIGIGDRGDRGPITIAEAVRAYTAGAAYGEFTDGVKGTLSVGKFADFVILSDDIFVADIARIPEANVVMTVVAGRVVYSANADTDNDKQ